MAQVYRLTDEDIFSISTGALATCLAPGASVCFGVFDGVHVGHQFLIEQCAATAMDSGPSVILTFDRDPDELFHAERLKKLMGNEQRIAALSRCDVDAVVVLPFTRRFADLAPHEFLDSVFAGAGIAHLHVGCDLRFGCRASGTVDDLASWMLAHHVQLHAHELLARDGLPVDSTRIRQELALGHVEKANELLGHFYAFIGEVRPGCGRGTDMGFATANLHIEPMLRVLGDGVYAAYVMVGDTRYKAAVSVGVPPTFDDVIANSEVHILDYSGDLVGCTIEVLFTHWLRPMMKFPSVDELIETVMGNIEWVRENL